MNDQRYVHNYLLVLIMCFPLLTFNGCNYFKNFKIRLMIKHEYGKVLDFSWTGYQLMTDTILKDFQINKPITVVSHIDDKLCPECFAKYLRAAELYVNQFHSDSVQYVCIAYARSIEDFQYALSLAKIDTSKIKVIYDCENQYLTKNSITKLASGYNAFLIDSKHKIKLLGDPLRNQSMYNLCKMQIQSMLNDL